MIPEPPSTVRIDRATSIADRTFSSLPKLIISGVSRAPATAPSLTRPKWCASRKALAYAPAASANLAWVSWKPAMGAPNCTRVDAYSSAVSRLSRSAPVAPQTIPNRASVRHESGPRRPRTSGSTAAPGNRTPSSTS